MKRITPQRFFGAGTLFGITSVVVNLVFDWFRIPALTPQLVVIGVLAMLIVWFLFLKPSASDDQFEVASMFSTVADTAPVMIWIADLDMKCCWFNKVWLDFTGRSMQDEMGDGWAQGVHPDDLQRCLDILTTNFKARKVFKMEYQLRRYDGQYRTVLNTGSPRYDKDNNFCGYAGSCIDTSDFKINEKELVAAKEAAEAANRFKSDFLANMSHEVRTPLNGMMGMIELALDCNVDKQAREWLLTARQSGASLLRIVNDILDLSKIEAGKLYLEFAECDFHLLVADVCQLFAAEVKQKGLMVTAKFVKSLQPVIADAVRLRQVLTNIFGNAVKFTQSGGITITVDADPPEHGNCRIKVSVADTGIGIPRSKFPEVFSRQADTSNTRRYGGTGLGLALSDRIIQLMGGQIDFSSKFGEGSTFWFSLTLPVVSQFAAGLSSTTTSATSHLEFFSQRGSARSSENVSRRSSEPRDRSSPASSRTHSRAPSPVTSRTHSRAPSPVPGHTIETFSAPLGTGHLSLTPPSALHIQPSQAEQIAETRQRMKEAQIAAQEAHSNGQPMPFQAGYKPHVLVVDDYDVNRVITARLLERLGCTVDVACDGREAVTRATDSSFDLILMDCQMPDMDGYEATQLIRAMRPSSKIVALTADATQKCRDRCVSVGMSDYVCKPVMLADLAAIVQKWLGQPVKLPYGLVGHVPANGTESPVGKKL